MFSIRSVILTWVILVTLLSGCAGAYQPGVTVANGAPLCMGECKDVIRHVLAGGDDTILLTRNGSYVFGQLTRDGWRVVLAQPKGAGELLSNAKTPDYQAFLKALKESGWEKVPLAGVSAVVRQFFGIMGNFLFMFFTGIESLPGFQTVGIG